MVTPEQFRAALERDRASGNAFLPELATKWNLWHAMHRYTEGMLPTWVGAFREEARKHDPATELVLSSETLARSRYEHKRLLVAMGYPEVQVPEALVVFDAVDYMLQRLIPGKTDVVMDYGPGYGRAALAWAREAQRYIGVEGIEGPYVLQSQVFDKFVSSYKDYLHDPQTPPDNCQLWHVPSWHLDKVPSESVDLILCVHVLTEIDQEFLPPLVHEFTRVSKRYGRLYVRDYSGIELDRLLNENGWRLMFQYPSDWIHGMPKIWCRVPLLSTYGG